MGGGSSGQPISRSMEAELWQGHPQEPEGWETTVQLTYAASFAIFALMGFAPDTSIKSWASGEARARLELQAEGSLDKAVFGVHYNVLPEEKAFDFEFVNPDNPFNEVRADLSIISGEGGRQRRHYCVTNFDSISILITG